MPAVCSKTISPSRGAPLALSPPGGAMAAFAMWGDRLSPVGYASAAVVLLGGLLMVGGGEKPVTEPPHA